MEAEGPSEMLLSTKLQTAPIGSLLFPRLDLSAYLFDYFYVLVSLLTWRWKQEVLPKRCNLSTKLQTAPISSLLAPRHVIPSLCHWLSYQSVLHFYLKMDLPNSNEILVVFYQATRRHIPEYRSLHCPTVQQLVSDKCLHNPS
jgi:hypothetical protein